MRKRTIKPELISLGLLAWSLGQIIWMAGIIKLKKETPYPFISDIPYLASLIFWNFALHNLYKPLKLNFIKTLSPISGVYKVLLSAIIPTVVLLNHSITKNIQSQDILKLLTDFIYLFLTVWSAFVAGALFLAKIPLLSLRTQRCIKFLFYATLLNLVANACFIVTSKLPPDDFLVYRNGSWVDLLFFISMLCWCISTTIYPTNTLELNYSFDSYGSRTINKKDALVAAEIAETIFKTNHNKDQLQINYDTTIWFIKNIPGCWKIIKCGNEIIGSVLGIPCSKDIMDDFSSKKITERELFKRVQEESEVWFDCFYLAGATVIPEHRLRGLASNCAIELIENITSKFESITFFCWPITEEGIDLAEKLKKHFPRNKINVLIDEIN